MIARDTLDTLGRKLDEQAGQLARLDSYYRGDQPLTFIAPEAKTALGGRLQRVSVNVPRLVVGSLVERLRVTGLHRDGAPDPELWAAWRASQLDQTGPVAMREALTLGRSAVIVWARAGLPLATVESAHQVTVKRDPATRTVTAALKRWSEPADAAGVPGRSHVVVFQPDAITRYTANAPGAPTSAWSVDGTLRNPFGVVPVVELVNGDRLLGDGVSEFADVISLTDLLVKTLTDMAVTSEFYARPRRWATGVEVPVDDEGNATNPFASDADRTWISEAPESKFGQFAATDLAGYENAVRTITQQISAVTGLPEHVLGIGSDNPTSADAIRASEAALTAKAEARQRAFGPAWEQVARLMIAARDGTDPASVDVSVQWADPATRSIAQESDSVVKLYAAGVIGRSTALRRLGYTDAEIERIRSEARADALDAAGTDLSAFVGSSPS
jgi:hypothetical protein